MSERFEKAQKIYSECVSNEKYDRGFEELDGLIRDGVDIHSALQLRSHLHYLAGNKIQAKRDLDEAIELEPESGGLYYDRGVLHHHLKEYYLALRDFCEAVQLAQAMGDDDLIDAAEHHFIEILEQMRST
ncbi:hypothetical protein P4B35_13630 [Pontiellaceae bacterium B12227]|nr:hypothetical protein [Pontiellaceae bacterium B12227]